MRLLRLRNPQGTNEWQGDWSDKSDKWTPKLRNALGASDEDDGFFFIAIEDYINNFRCTSINFTNAQDLNVTAVKESRLMHDFASQEDSQTSYQLAQFSLILSREIDLSQDILTISINQQGDRLQTYRNKGEDRFVPARFNIMLIQQPGGTEPPVVVKCVHAAWLQTSLVLHGMDGVTTLPRGTYLINILAQWPQNALENPDLQLIQVAVHAPCPTQMRAQATSDALKTLQKLFISDGLRKIKAGKAETYEGEFENSAFRVLEARPFEDMLFGYVYTQNSNQSEHPLREVISLKECEGCDTLRTDGEDGWESEQQQLTLDLDPGTSDLVVFVHTNPQVTLKISSRVTLRKLTREELCQQTRDLGVVRKVGSSKCEMRCYKGPHSYGLLLNNTDQIIQIFLRFNKVNYRVEGEADGSIVDGVFDVEKVLAPGAEVFIRLEKIYESCDASVKTSFRYCVGGVKETKDEVVGIMLKAATTNPPQQLKFQGKTTDVFMYRSDYKGSIWFMWENKTQRGPHAPVENEAPMTDINAERKHRHRDRPNETTFFAKYRFQTTNMSLVEPDEPKGDTWSFSLPAGEGQRIVRQLLKGDHDSPGVKYQLKVSSQFKFLTTNSK